MFCLSSFLLWRLLQEEGAQQYPSGDTLVPWSWMGEFIPPGITVKVGRGGGGGGGKSLRTITPGFPEGCFWKGTVPSSEGLGESSLTPTTAPLDNTLFNWFFLLISLTFSTLHPGFPGSALTLSVPKSAPAVLSGAHELRQWSRESPVQRAGDSHSEEVASATSENGSLWPGAPLVLETRACAMPEEPGPGAREDPEPIGGAQMLGRSRWGRGR